MRLTMRVDLPHLGQSVLLLVSITFLRSAVFAIFAPTAMVCFSWSRQYVRSDPLNIDCGACGWECFRNQKTGIHYGRLLAASRFFFRRCLFYSKPQPPVLAAGS